MQFVSLVLLKVATWVVTPELFSTQTRTMGHSSCTAVSRVGSFVAAFVVVSRLPYAVVGIILGVFNICAAAAALFLPETTGRRCWCKCQRVHRLMYSWCT
jgi:hypothetical protein